MWKAKLRYPFWRGRICMVDSLLLSTSNELLFKLKKYFSILQNDLSSWGGLLIFAFHFSKGSLEGYNWPPCTNLFGITTLHSENFLNFIAKWANFVRRSTVLILLLQIAFPCQTQHKLFLSFNWVCRARRTFFAFLLQMNYNAFSCYGKWAAKLNLDVAHIS